MHMKKRNQQKIKRLIPVAGGLLTVVILLGVLLLYKPIQRKLLVKHILDKVFAEYMEGTAYHQERGGYLKEVRIERIYDSSVPDHYWVELTETWRDRDVDTDYRKLFFVYTDTDEAYHLTDLTNKITITHTSKEQFVVTSVNHPLYKNIDIYRSDEGRPNWVLTASQRGDESDIGSTFRETDKQYSGGDDAIGPLFEPNCASYERGTHVPDDQQIEPKTKLIGGILDGKYRGLIQKFYLEEPIEVDCIENEKYYGGNNPFGLDRPYVNPTIGSPITYEDPYIRIGWPGGTTLFLDVSRYRLGDEDGWQEVNDMIHLIHEGRIIPVMDQPPQP